MIRRLILLPLTITTGSVTDAISFIVNSANTVSLSPSLGDNGTIVAVILTGTNTSVTPASTVSICGDRIKINKVNFHEKAGPGQVPAQRKRDAQGGAALLWGEQPSSAAWGEPSRPGFPRRG